MQSAAVSRHGEHAKLLCSTTRRILRAKHPAERSVGLPKLAFPVSGQDRLARLRQHFNRHRAAADLRRATAHLRNGHLEGSRCVFIAITGIWVRISDKEFAPRFSALPNQTIGRSQVAGRSARPVRRRDGYRDGRRSVGPAVAGNPKFDRIPLVYRDLAARYRLHTVASSRYRYGAWRPFRPWNLHNGGGSARNDRRVLASPEKFVGKRRYQHVETASGSCSGAQRRYERYPHSLRRRIPVGPLHGSGGRLIVLSGQSRAGVRPISQADGAVRRRTLNPDLGVPCAPVGLEQAVLREIDISRVYARIDELVRNILLRALAGGVRNLYVERSGGWRAEPRRASAGRLLGALRIAKRQSCRPGRTALYGNGVETARDSFEPEPVRWIVLPERPRERLLRIPECDFCRS